MSACVPQHRLSPAAKHCDVRPSWIDRDEGLETGKVGAIIAAAEDRPFHQLAGGRIGDPLLRVRRIFLPAATGEAERIPHRGKIGRGDGRPSYRRVAQRRTFAERH
jgi:hypothetical protein